MNFLSNPPLRFPSLFLQPLRCGWLAALLLASGVAQSSGDRLSLHPENGRYVEFRGKPVVLMGSTEHYGAVINGDFDYRTYLDEVRATGLNLVRIFAGPYVEKPGDFSIPENTLSPKPESLIVPWARSDQDGPAGFGKKFDLTQWDPAYFKRLKDFVAEADQRDIVVELTFFCPYYTEGVWEMAPVNPLNHINEVGAGGRLAVHQVDSDQLPFQRALVRKIMEELKGTANVYYETVNEPYTSGSGTTPAWEALILQEIVDVQADWPEKHLIAMNVANFSSVIQNPSPEVSIFNFHYANADAALLNQGIGRLIGNNETGFVGNGENNKDFPYRRQAWEFMLSGGGSFNHLDYSFTDTRENGIASPSAPIDTANPSTSPKGGGGPAIRRQLGFLRWFLEELPLLNCTPQPAFITAGVPTDGVVRVFGGSPDGNPGSPMSFGLYLRGGTQANLVADLPAGTYRGRWMDPRSGAVVSRLPRFDHVGGAFTLVSPNYVEDVALLLIGGDLAAPEVELSVPLYRTVAAGDKPVVLTAEATVDAGVLTAVEFLENANVIGTATEPPYSLTLTGLSPGKREFRARALASDGRSADSPPVKCQVVGAFHSGVNLNGAEVNLAGQLIKSTADALGEGMVLTNFNNLQTDPALPLYPLADSATKALVSGQVRRTTTSDLGIAYPLANGTYDVFLSVIEGEQGYGRDMRVRIEGVTVAKGIGYLALGEWVNYGPYRTKIEDGVLNISLGRETLIRENPASPEPPKIAGFSIYETTPDPDLESAVLEIDQAPGLALLSWPRGVAKDRVEASFTLGEGGDWQPLQLPAQDFTEAQQIAVPTSHPRRFFRLRKN